MPWVKFHEALTKGAKRGIKRAHRMVYMELSLAARPKRGFVELPLGMGDVDGVCDLLGGDVREVRDALKVLTSGAEPMVSFEGPAEARRLVVASWQRWNTVEPAGASTERSRRHRVSGNEQETAEERPSNGDATTVAGRLQRSRNDDATGCNDRPSGEKRREEKKREEKEEIPELGPDGPSEPVGSGHLFGSDVVAGGSPKASAATEVFAVYIDGWRKRIGKGAEPKLTDARRALVRARIKDHSLEQLKAAAAGVWLSDFHVENQHTSFELVMRNAGKVEQFAALVGTSQRQGSRVNDDSPAPIDELPARFRNQKPAEPEAPATLEDLREQVAKLAARGVAVPRILQDELARLEAEQETA
jgi:hypothetical protein